MLYALGVIVFAVGLLLSIALHEVGHMVPAKRFGVKVTQYMVGFGPTLWSRKRGDTEYGFKAIPLGGYIRMIGMVPPRDGRRSRWPRRMSTAIEDFRKVSRSEVLPEDSAREFYRLTPGKKMIVMLGGPCMNLFIYLILTVILLLTIGSPDQKTTTTVGLVVKCVVPATSKDATSDTCPKNAVAAPAYKRLQPGDVIESIGGVKLGSWDQLVSIVEPASGKTLQVVVRRDGVDRTLAIRPVSNLKYVGNSTTGKPREAGFLGISPVESFFYKSQTIADVPGQIGSQLSVGVHAIASYPQKLHNLWQTVFEGKQRDRQGAIGIVGIGRLGGQIADDHAITVQSKTYTLISLLASVNLLLFFFNLLPLLPLDGGHVAGALVEAAKRGRARLRYRRHAPPGTPGTPPHRPQIFVDTAQMLPVMYGVASVLILVTLLTLYADIVNPISING